MTSPPVLTERVDNTVPTDLRTFLIADVRGYSRFTQERGDEAAALLTSTFASIAQEVVSSYGGDIIELRGDEILAAFGSARKALRSAVELQKRVLQSAQSDPAMAFTIGIGLDAGEAVSVGDGFRGSALNLAARLCSLAGPNEVLCSDGVTHLARKIEGLSYQERGVAQLKGFSDPVAVVRVVSDDLPGDALATKRGYPSSPRLPTAIRGTAPVRAVEPDVGGLSILPAARDGQLPIGGFLGALPETMIVGRDDELVRLAAVLDAVTSGVGRTVFLAGEPGVGKTRLAQEVTLAARNRAFLVASGTCYEADQSVPYYPFLEVLSTLLAQAPEPIRSSVPERWQQVLRLLPNQDWTPVASNDTQDEQLRLFWAVTEFVLSLADVSPVAILIDDLHWSDASSLSLFEHLARNTRTHPVLLLGTYRDVEVGRLHPLERTLLNLGRQRLVERVGVKRLTESGTAAMMASTVGIDEVSSDFSGLVHRRTDGNPFFVEEVVRALVERGDVYRENGQWERRGLEEIEVPESVRSVIGQRLSRLTASTQEILREAAVLGLSFGFGDLQSITERPETEVEAAVEEAKSVALLRESGGDNYAFNHALTQQALYEELSLRRKRRLHLAAAASLEELPDTERRKRAAELARHLLQGDDSEAALPYALLAGDQAAAMFAHYEAQGQFRTAAELATEIGDKTRTAEALTKLGRTLFYAGRSRDALVELGRAAELYSGLGYLEAEALAVAQMGWCHFEQGTPEEGIPRLQEMIVRAEGASLSACLAALYSAISNLYYLSGRYRDQLAASERAVALSWVVADDRLRGQAEVRRGMALVTLGRLEEGIKAYQTAIPLAEAAQDLDTLYRAYSNLNMGLSHSGRTEAARETEQRLYALEERIGNPAHAATLTSVEGWHLWMSGDWTAARQKFELALRMFRSTTSNRAVLIPRVGLAVLNELEGDVDGAVEELESVVAEGRRTGNVEITSEADVWLCWAYIARGETDRAIQHLQVTVDFSREQGVKGLGARNFMVYALCELGDYERAAAAGASVVKDAGDVGSPLTQSLGRIFYGRALGGVGRFEESRVVLEEGIRLAHDMPFVYGEGLGQLEYGRMLHQQDENAAARNRLEVAYQIFARLGAKRELDRTNAFLHALS